MNRYRVGNLEELHAALRELVAQIVAVADAHEVTCLAAYGTALGAERDGDLIAWDTDADLVVPMNELSRLVAALRSDLDAKQFQVLTPHVKNVYDHLFPRVSLVGIDHNLVHVDLFPLVGTFTNETLAAGHLILAKGLRVAFMLKRTHSRVRYAHDSRKRWMARAVRLLLSPLPGGALIHLFEVLSGLRPLRRDGQTINLGGSYGVREIVPLRVYLPPRAGSLKDISINLPGQTDEYLTRMYGEYTTPPSRAVRDSALQFFYNVTLPKILCSRESRGQSSEGARVDPGEDACRN